MSEERTFHILVINPGSTSTKLSLFRNDREVLHQTWSHSMEDLKGFRSVAEQADFRSHFIDRFLGQKEIDVHIFDAVAARGGLLKPIESGVYSVNRRMREDLVSARFGEHASNLGALLAWAVSEKVGCPAFIADPVVVDEMEEMARLTGFPEIRRKSIFHALNQKSAAREVARMLGKPYEDCNFIVAHMGGGISVGAHRRGRVVDVNNALDGDGPFSPERAGSLPAGQLVELCFSGKYDREEIFRKVTERGGLVAHRESNNFKELKEAKDRGDNQARLIYEALVYKVSQEICKHGATLNGQVDRIILTGGMAMDNLFTRMIRKRVQHLTQVEIIPGEREMLSLALAVLAVLRKEMEQKEYV
jgi:butyrate kinase